MRFGSDVYVVPVDDSLSSATVMYCSAPGPFPGHVDVQVSMYVGGYLLSTNTISYGYRGDCCFLVMFVILSAELLLRSFDRVSFVDFGYA